MTDAFLCNSFILFPDHTASLVLLSSLKALPRSSSLPTLKIPIMLRDGASDLSSTGTITVTVCPCQSGGMWAEERKQQTDEKDIVSVPDWERQTACLPSPSNSPLLGVSSAAMLAILACASTLLGQFCFSVPVVRFCDCCSPFTPPLYPAGLMMCCCYICPSLPVFIHHCLLACLQIAAFLPYLCFLGSFELSADLPRCCSSVCQLGLLMNVLGFISAQSHS